jgi:tetratricopeptide (TPR) repeat protein
VKDRSVFVARPELAFSQLFFPIKGILAIYDRQTGAVRSLPGADDPAFVQSNPTWSPDGKHIVFARAAAYRLKTDKGNVLLSQAECAEFLEEGKTFLFDLYRIPFNDGAGGVPEPLAGAAQNGMSNFFAKYSPDGQWIVFCKARSFMLLQPDSELYIIPAAGGEARRLRCNTGRMNSWHSWSPNGKWLVFSSKENSPYTQLFLTHIDEQGRSTPPVLLAHFTAPDRAANIPEFVHARPDAIKRIREQFIDDVSYVRAGDMYLAADDVAGAIRQYRKALELNAASATAHSNLGGLLSTEGQFNEAELHLREALRLDPESGAAHFNLGIMLFQQGRNEEATEHLSAAVRLKPEHATAQRTLGVLLANKGMPEQAVVHLREAVRLEPDNATAHYCLAKALVGQGKTEEAIEHLRSAVRLEPDYAAADYLLGQVLFRAGRTADAIGYLASAADARPDDAQLLRDLAWVLATAPEPELRDAAQAVELAKRACALTGYRAIEPLDTLGVCHAAAGEFAEAIRAAEQALRVARAAGQAAIAEKIMERIELYQQGSPYRPPSASANPERQTTKGGNGE